MKPIVHHPNGVMVGGRLYLRDEYFAASRVSLREWCALIVLLVGLALWLALMLGGLAWLIYTVVHRWR